MDPVANKRVLAEACAALGIELTGIESAQDIYDKLLYNRKVQKREKTPTPAAVAVQQPLDELTYKAQEKQRLSLVTTDASVVNAEVERRWTLVRGTALAADNILYIDRETATEEMLAQLSADKYKLVLSEVGGFHFVGTSAPAAKAEAESETQDGAIDPSPDTLVSEPSAKEMAVDAAMKRLQATKKVHELPEAEATVASVVDGAAAEAQGVAAEKDESGAEVVESAEAKTEAESKPTDVVKAAMDIDDEKERAFGSKEPAPTLTVDMAQSLFRLWIEKHMSSDVIQSMLAHYCLSEGKDIDQYQRPALLVAMARDMFPN